MRERRENLSPPQRCRRGSKRSLYNSAVRSVHWRKVEPSEPLRRREREISRLFFQNLLAAARGYIKRKGAEVAQFLTAIPWDNAFFFIFTFKICLHHQTATPFLRATPSLEKNPVSAPVLVEWPGSPQLLGLKLTWGGRGYW